MLPREVGRLQVVIGVLVKFFLSVRMQRVIPVIQHSTQYSMAL